MNENNMLAIIESNDLPSHMGENIKNIFGGLIVEAKNIAKESKMIIVDSDDDHDKMNEARKKRLLLKSIRVEAEKKKKTLKESIVRNGRAIDGVFNIVKAITVEAEQYLSEQENYTEIKKRLEWEKIIIDRKDQISKYTDASLYNVDNLDDFSFSSLINQIKEAHENKIKAEKQNEINRQNERLENERLKKENERLENELYERSNLQREKEKEINLDHLSDNDKIMELANQLASIKMPNCELEKNNQLVNYAKLSIKNIIKSLQKIN